MKSLIEGNTMSQTMSYKISDEETLSKAIRIVMDRHSHVGTQKELTALVRKELTRMDPDYHVGGERIRRVGIDRNLLKIVIEYNESSNTELPEICPVCKNAMEPLMNMSLDGDIVEVKRKCTVCPYSIGQKPLTPRKYGFSRTAKEDVSDNVNRIRKLEKAKAKLREASNFISDALKMTGMEARGEYIRETLKEISDSEEESCSISNIILDIKDSDKDSPGWTRPTVSIKNVNRKDI